MRFAFSLPSFAQAAVVGDLSEFGGMFSEAKVLEDIYGITIQRRRSGSGLISTTIRGPGLDFQFNDDVLGSGTRHAMATISSRLPELLEFATTPVLQFGSGISYSSLFDNYDFAGFIRALESWCPDTHRRAKQLFDTRVECVMDGYRLVTLISDFLLKYRTGVISGSQETTEEPEPFARPEEVTGVLCGNIRKSVRFEKTPAEHLQDALSQLFLGDCDWIDGNFIVYKQQKDPLAYFGGTHLDVEKLLTYNFEPLDKTSNTESCPITEVKGGPSDKIISDAVHLVEQYNMEDVQNLPPEVKVVAHYGSPKGKEIFNYFSKSFVNTMFSKSLGEERYVGIMPKEWIQRVRQHMETRVKPKDKESPDIGRVLALLAAGRTVAAKGTIDFDVMWRFIKAQPPH